MHAIDLIGDPKVFQPTGVKLRIMCNPTETSSSILYIAHHHNPINLHSANGAFRIIKLRSSAISNATPEDNTAPMARAAIVLLVVLMGAYASTTDDELSFTGIDADNLHLLDLAWCDSDEFLESLVEEDTLDLTERTDEETSSPTVALNDLPESPHEQMPPSMPSTPTNSMQVPTQTTAAMSSPIQLSPGSPEMSAMFSGMAAGFASYCAMGVAPVMAAYLNNPLQESLTAPMMMPLVARPIMSPFNVAGGSSVHLAAIWNLPSNLKCSLDCISPSTRLAEQQDSNGFTALHYAAMLGHNDIVDMLLSSCKFSSAAIAKQDLQGYTALHAAVKFARASIVSALLSSDKLTITMARIRSHAGETAVQMAARLHPHHHLLLIAFNDPKCFEGVQ